MSDRKQIYTVPTRYVFKGEFKIKAASRAQAEEYVREYCGLTIGHGFHTTLPYDEVSWDFDIHPEEIVGEAIHNVSVEVGMLKSLLKDYHNRDIDDIAPICDDMVFYVEKLFQKIGV